MNETTYVERTEQYNAETLAARLADDAAKYQSFRTETDAIQVHTLPAARLGREIGLSFQAYWLPARADLAEAYFNQHYAPALGMSFPLFKWFIAISKKLPAQIEDMQDVLPSFQMMLFAGELLEEGQRTEPQVSHQITPFVFFRNQLSGLKADLERRLAESARWDHATRQSIKEEIHRTREWMETVEREL